MGHSVRLIIGRPHDVARLIVRWPQTHAVELLAGWTAAPLTDALYDALTASRPDGAAVDAFDMAPPGLPDALNEASREGGAIAYVETEYFGGTGDQSGGAWRDGGLNLAERGHGSINAALHAIGVIDAPGMDAFDTIGLGRRRSMDDYERVAPAGGAPVSPPESGTPAKGFPLWAVVAFLVAAIALGVSAAML